MKNMKAQNILYLLKLAIVVALNILMIGIVLYAHPNSAVAHSAKYSDNISLFLCQQPPNTLYYIK